MPYFTPDFPTNQIMDWDLDKGEILKTYKNEFEWLKTIFFMKEGIRDHFCTVSSDLKPFWQVTIFYTRLPHKPNHGLGLRQGWNSENLQKWVWIAQNDIFHERRHTRPFLQSFKWFQAILTSYHISHQTSPQTKSWIGTQTRVKFWKLTKMSLTGLKRFFSWKKAYAIIFTKFQVISSHFDKLPYFTSDFPTNQIMDWDLDKGEILKIYKNEFDWLKTIFFMNEGIRDHFYKVSSDLKPFWQVTIFHTRLPHKPNHGLGLRQGWNSENLQKWFWLAQNDFSHERRHTRSFLQSFKWFQAILTSYHVSHQTSPQTKSWIGT